MQIPLRNIWKRGKEDKMKNKNKVKSMVPSMSYPRLKPYVKIVIEGRNSKLFSSQSLPLFTQTLDGSWLEFGITLLDKDTLDFLKSANWFVITIKTCGPFNKNVESIKYRCQLENNKFEKTSDNIWITETFKLFAMVEK
jgi:hypothetical protein